MYNNKKTSQFTGTGAAHRQFAVQNFSKTFNISWNLYTHNIPSLKFLLKYNSCQCQSPEHIFVSKADTSLVQNQVHDEDDDDDDADLARALNPKWRKSMQKTCVGYSWNQQLPCHESCCYYYSRYLKNPRQISHIYLCNPVFCLMIPPSCIYAHIWDTNSFATGKQWACLLLQLVKNAFHMIGYIKNCLAHGNYTSELMSSMNKMSKL